MQSSSPAATRPAWHPEVYARRRPYLLKRSAVLAALRSFFAARDFVEVETPALQVSPGMEPHLQAFATELRTPDGSRQQLYLHTSPEFACKKLLVAGEPRLYALARVFRNGERAAWHHPEFTMLEWYRAGDGYETLMQDCGDLLRHCAEAIDCSLVEVNGSTCDPTAAPERISVTEAFRRWADIDLLATTPDPWTPDRDHLARQAQAAGIRVAEDDDWLAIFTKVMLARIEPRLGSPVPTILYDYPVSQAALSRPKPSDPRVAERFECYVAGVELANAFGELTEAVEQRRRFEADQALKQSLYGERYPIDEDFLDALAFGMPEAAGIALGVDRLVMLLSGAAHIEDVLWLPVAKP
ncbi:EF-P lysine aminoacylase EpmA [Aquibaculum arenosum]|uniref:EF-P lysine aminoacylase EpmA n=1 Tax=Aquibaculum arenosum TaxID=3032591 RepID=A0ABT5YJQ3_9PROT|nr:EF-P lysine aminoacylase EpmA [Fodinicurvata sp. CAU 1616]MDF2095176.1 EF-P lysine aminoacylase EpmA [Fodinicurvata sp. CAU 1616]